MSGRGARIGIVLRLFSRDYVIVTILLLVILASGSDLLGDLLQGVEDAHLVQEAAILAIAVAGLAWILLGLRQQGREIARLRREIEEAGQLPAPDNDRLRDARRRLADVIGEQFATWGLSKSEQEVGLLLLKGLSLKEIAIVRGTAEKTIRQQASSVYQKAGVSGRHVFAAWFIEDFL